MWIIDHFLIEIYHEVHVNEFSLIFFVEIICNFVLNLCELVCVKYILVSDGLLFILKYPSLCFMKIIFLYSLFLFECNVLHWICVIMC